MARPGKSLHDDDRLTDVDDWLSRPIVERIATVDEIRREHEGWEMRLNHNFVE